MLSSQSVKRVRFGDYARQRSNIVFHDPSRRRWIRRARRRGGGIVSGKWGGAFSRSAYRRVTQRSLAALLRGFRRRSSGLAVMVPSLISE